VETVESLLANQQVRERDAIVEVPDEANYPLRMTNVIPRFEGHARLPPTPGPAEIGLHTRDILTRDLGLTGAEFTHLQSIGAIGGEPLPASQKGLSHAG